jgi:GTPase SAR1 family protein
MNPSQIRQAQSVEEIFLTTQSSPLTTEAEIAAFYRDEVNAVRGGDKVKRLRLGLTRAHQNRTYFKALFMGHQGVGKSTELSRLVNQITPQFAVLRFSAVTTLDPVNFKPLDVILIMMVEIAEQTHKKIGQAPPDARLNEIWDWFATEKETREDSRSSGITMEAGGGIKEDSLWGKVSGLFANLKGEVKFASTRKKEVVEYRVSRLDDLMEILNRLLDDCNDLLRKATGQEWLFIGEDFDRANIPSDRIEELFITNAEIFHTMRTHMIFSLPISLYYSGKGARLPFSDDQSIVLPDTPVFAQDHQPNLSGQKALAAVLTARAKLDLFDTNQMERLITASGGNLRDLFSLVNYAADSAQLRSAQTVGESDVGEAIVHLRSAYERRLGQSPYDSEKVTYQNKADRLKQIYEGDSKAQVADEVIYSLLRSRAVQEFNGQRWFGVHPLVVDILVKQKEIPRPETGGVPGGTE